MFLFDSCTIGGMSAENRKRLGRAVVARRVQMNLKTTKALADKADLSPRMLGDVENGRRDNFSPGAKAQIERALEWAPGSIDSILEGGDPTPIAEAEHFQAVKQRVGEIYDEHVANHPQEGFKFVVPDDTPTARQPSWSPFKSRSFVDIFQEWQAARIPVLNLELEYAIGRHIDPELASDELRDVLEMLEEHLRGDGRPFTPPWNPGDEFEPGDEPWKRDWWVTSMPHPDRPGVNLMSLSSGWDAERVRAYRREKEEDNGMEAAQESPASATGDKDKKSGLSDKPEAEGLDDASKLIIASAADVDERDDGSKESG